MPKDDGNRLKAVELAKRLLVDAIWKTANIEVDGITFPDAQEIFEGRAPSNMEVNDIIVVNNIKRAWMFLFENIGRPIDWRYVSEYNRILGEGLIRDAGKLRTNDVRIGGTDRIPELPTMESSHDEISSLMNDRITRGPCFAHVLQDHARTMVQRRKQGNRAAGPNCASPSSASAATP